MDQPLRIVLQCKNMDIEDFKAFSTHINNYLKWGWGKNHNPSISLKDWENYIIMCKRKTMAIDIRPSSKILYLTFGYDYAPLYTNLFIDIN